MARARVVSARADSLLAPGRRRITVALAMLPVLVAFEALAVSTVMPRASAELGGMGLYPLVFAGPPATSLIAVVLAATWCDHGAATRVMTAGCAVLCAALLLVGLAPSMIVLVLGRAVQGVGMGLVSVALYVLIARLYPARLQGQMFTVLSAGWVLPGVVGPAIAGALADTVGWRVIFWAMPLLIIPVRLLLHDPTGAASAPVAPPEGEVAARPPVLAAGLSALGVGILSFAGDRVAHARAPLDLLLLALGLVLVLVTTPRLLPRSVLRSVDGVGALVIARGLVAAAFVLAEVYLPLQLIARYHLSAAHAGLILTVSTLTWFAGAWVAGRDLLPETARVPLGAGTMVAGILATGTVLLVHAPTAVAIATWCLTGLGMGLAYTSTSILTMRRSHPARQGANSSALQIAESLVQAVMLAVVGLGFQLLLAQRGAADALPYALNAAAAAMLALLATGVGLHRGRRAA